MKESPYVQKIRKNPDERVFTGVYLTKKMPAGRSILDTYDTPIKLLITKDQCPGDHLMFTAALRDLALAYPKEFILGVDVPDDMRPLYENNPYIYDLDPLDQDIIRVKAQYDTMFSRSLDKTMHFVHGHRIDLEEKLGLQIPSRGPTGDIHLTEEERLVKSQVFDIIGRNTDFWLINSGYKNDFTAKNWGHHNYQAVVDALPDVTFVQVGLSKDNHEILKGDNIINLIDQTSIRDMIKLCYWAAGAVTGVSFLMHLSAAVPMHNRYARPTRPCVVLGGGRESPAWEAYPWHSYFHTVGTLDCCFSGGCWKSRTERVGLVNDKHNKSLCEKPFREKGKPTIPLCMQMIRPSSVVQAIKDYRESYRGESKWPKRFVSGDLEL